MSASAASHSTYRTEIDGLRAVAVLGVVLFHAGLGLGGGFVGVDIFFVISGYLITGIIAKGLVTGTFTLSDFFTRRIKRILPASATMVVVVALAGALLLVPSDFERMMRAAFWNAALLANYHFSQQTGYFAEAAELQPLLHMWSLAVEEQFYLIFPGVMLLVHRFARRHMLRIICLLGVASLAFSIWQTTHNETQAFYLLPARAWELLAGAALALAPARGLSRVASNVLSFGGVAAISYAFLMFDTNTPFPGAWALVPVLGTVAVIAGATDQASAVHRVLASRPLVAVGKLSYSIYLWHWPLFAFANLLMTDVSPALRATLALSSVALAIPSYYLIEQPFRRGFLIPTPRRAVRFAFATAVLIGGASGLTDLMDGFAGRFPAPLQPFLEDVTWTGQEYSTGEGRGPVRVGRAEDGAPPDFILWGDSHARMLAAGFDEVARELGLSGDVYAVSGQPPVPGVWKYGDDESDIESSLKLQQSIEARVLDSRAKIVVLAARWSLSCVGHSEAEVEAGSEPDRSLLVDEPTDSPPSPQVAAETLRRHLAALIERLESRGMSVWIIEQCPECESVNPARDFLKSKIYPSLYSDKTLDEALTTLAEHRQRQEYPRRIFAALAGTGADFVDPSASFFDERGLLRLKGERCYYRDNDHLTRAGIRELLRPHIVDLLSQAKVSSETEAPMHAVSPRASSDTPARQATRNDTPGGMQSRR